MIRTTCYMLSVLEQLLTLVICYTRLGLSNPLPQFAPLNFGQLSQLIGWAIFQLLRHTPVLNKAMDMLDLPS